MPVIEEERVKKERVEEVRVKEEKADDLLPAQQDQTISINKEMSDLLSKLGPAQAKVNAKKDELSRNRTILEQKQDVVKQTEAELEVVMNEQAKLIRELIAKPMKITGKRQLSSAKDERPNKKSRISQSAENYDDPPSPPPGASGKWVLEHIGTGGIHGDQRLTDSRVMNNKSKCDIRWYDARHKEHRSKNAANNQSADGPCWQSKMNDALGWKGVPNSYTDGSECLMCAAARRQGDTTTHCFYFVSPTHVRVFVPRRIRS